MSKPGGKRRSFSDHAAGRAGGTFCGEFECLNLAARDGRCWTHVKRRQEGRRGGDKVREYGLSPLAALRKAALVFADAPSEDDAAYRRADDLLRKAALRYAKG